MMLSVSVEEGQLPFVMWILIPLVVGYDRIESKLNKELIKRREYE
jgi:hypothetical protein